MNKDVKNPKIKRGCMATIGIWILGVFVASMITPIVLGAISMAYVTIKGLNEQALISQINMGNYESIKGLAYIVVIVSVTCIGVVPIVVSIALRNKRVDNSEVFGDARFSKVNELKAQGLEGAGIVFGKINNMLVTKPSKKEGHTLVVGGTGTGKSRGIVIPTLFKWEGSAIVMDIKGELSRITSDFRANKGNAIYIFSPEKECHKYNPIALCNNIDSAQELARTIIPIPETGEAFWSQSAQAILSAYVYEGALKGYYLSDIAEKLCTMPIIELIEHCKTNEIREVKLLCSIAYDMPEKTLGGVMAELKSKLITIATDDNIRRATSGSDWTPKTLENNSTVYMQVSEHLLEQYRPLWTVIINQIIRYLSMRDDGKDPAILIALDEMPRLGKIEGLTGALATLRSRNVHILGIIQSMAQLDEIYNENNRKIIADNCGYKLVLSATDPETQEYFSKLSGKSTVFGVGVNERDKTNSYTQTETHLIKPEQWARLEQPILFAPRLQPTKINMAFWDKEGFDKI